MKYFVCIVFSLYSLLCFSLEKDSTFFSELPSYPPFLEHQDYFWIDSLLSQMTIEQKIGQSFFVSANSHSLEESEFFFKKVDELIKKNQIGGLIFFKSSPNKIVELVNRYQAISKIPLINSIDGEWGVSMRIDSTPIFPWAMTLGAVQDNNLIYEMGKEIANQCKILGLHMNFSPWISTMDKGQHLNT